MTNIYISTGELKAMLDELTPAEMGLYNLVKGSVMSNEAPIFYESKSLAISLGIKTTSVANLRSSLRTKGWLLITKFKDERGEPMVRVVIGKDQVTLYNLGLNVEITDAKAYKNLVKMFPFDDPETTLEERKALVAQANQYYKENNNKS